ncbi:MAG: transporter substrate-binding domain-containing protein [Orrella sp.]
MRQLTLALLTLTSAFFAGCSDEKVTVGSPNESSDVSTTKVINVAVAPASPPTLYEQDGEIKGSDLDIFSAYCESRGCTMNITAYDWQGMLGAISSGQADVAFSGIGITEHRQQAMDFSDPYAPVVLHLVAKGKTAEPITDLATVKALRIGYPRGMAFDDLIREEFEPNGYYTVSQARLYPSYVEAITDLQNGNLDLAFVEGPVLRHMKNRQKLPIKEVYSFEVDIALGFAFAKGSPLKDDFNEFMTSLGPTKIAEIIVKAAQ